jgi:hypothetical protein
MHLVAVSDDGEPDGRTDLAAELGADLFRREIADVHAVDHQDLIARLEASSRSRSARRRVPDDQLTRLVVAPEDGPDRPLPRSPTRATKCRERREHREGRAEAMMALRGTTHASSIPPGAGISVVDRRAPSWCGDDVRSLVVASMVGLALGVGLGALGCALGTEQEPGCHGDGDCGAGWVCRAGACFGLTTGLSSPDAAADGGDAG